MLAHFGWFWFVEVSFGLFWIVLVSSGVVLVGFSWIWLDLVGSGFGRSISGRIAGRIGARHGRPIFNCIGGFGILMKRLQFGKIVEIGPIFLSYLRILDNTGPVSLPWL